MRGGHTVEFRSAFSSRICDGREYVLLVRLVRRVCGRLLLPLPECHAIRGGLLLLEVVVGFGRESGCVRRKSRWFREGVVNLLGLGEFWGDCDREGGYWGGGGLLQVHLLGGEAGGGDSVDDFYMDYEG